MATPNSQDAEGQYGFSVKHTQKNVHYVIALV